MNISTLDYIYINDPAQTKEIAKFKEWLKKKNVIALDTETTGLDPFSCKLITLQIGDSEQQWIFNCFDLGDQIILDLLNSIKIDRIKKILHNAKFDYNMIRANYGVCLDNIYCTFIAASLLNAGNQSLGAGLDDVLKKWLGVSIEKDTRKDFSEYVKGKKLTTKQLAYCATDVQHLVNLYLILTKTLAEREASGLEDLEMACVYVTADLEFNGIHIDKQKWIKGSRVAEREAFKYLSELENQFSDIYPKNLFGNISINFNSPVQVKEALEKLLKITLKSTNANDLEMLKNDYEVINLLLKYREYMKLVTTYGEKSLEEWINPTTQRIHSSFKQLGAGTGRYSSTNPNLQNIPVKPEYREPFSVDNPDELRMVSADFSNQELRLLVFLSQEPNFLKALSNKMDLHAYSASLLFDIPYENFFKWKEDGTLDYSEDPDGFLKEMKKDYRNKAKSITFGLIYGMGPTKLAKELNISFDEAKQLLSKYFETFPSVKKLLDTYEKDLRKTKMAVSKLDGRIKNLAHIDWDNKKLVGHAINQAKNFPFQGTGASITKRAMVYLRNRILKENLDAKLVLTVHDEILIETKKDIADKVSSMMVEEMQRAFNFYAPDIEMPISPKIGTCWIH